MIDFLIRDIIDPYPECKWKPPWRRSWQPALVLLGRWERMCEKIKAICLDAAMSSVCCVWCKQLHLSRYDEPWTVITCCTHWDPQPSGSKTRQPPAGLLSLTNLFEDMTAFICMDHSQITKVSKVGGLWLHKLPCQSHTWSVCSVNNILYQSVERLSTCPCYPTWGKRATPPSHIHNHTHIQPVFKPISSTKCPLTQPTAHPIS